MELLSGSCVLNKPLNGDRAISLKSVDDINVFGKKALVRLDLNVPVRNGNITDTTRMERALPTVRSLLDRGASVIIASHFDRPRGRVVPAMSLRPVAQVFAGMLDEPVSFVDQVVGERVEHMASMLAPGDVMMIENLRFDIGEESNDALFADSLARLADIYVNDSFSCSHRAHASVDAIASRLPSFAGLNMIREIDALREIFSGDRAPRAALVGGAKISTKLSVLTNLVSKVDYLILGGGMANTFLLADGYSLGASLCERNMLPVVAQIRSAAEKSGCTLVLPEDVRIADAFDKPETARECRIDEIPDGGIVLDVGSASIAALERLLRRVTMLLWNGPLGVFETPPFDTGTNAIALCAARYCKLGNLVVVAGGGDTISALQHAGVADDLTYVSTAGGAFLEWLEGKKLPGIEALLARS